MFFFKRCKGVVYKDVFRLFVKKVKMGVRENVKAKSVDREWLRVWNFGEDMLKLGWVIIKKRWLIFWCIIERLRKMKIKIWLLYLVYKDLLMIFESEVCL